MEEKFPAQTLHKIQSIFYEELEKEKDPRAIIFKKAVEQGFTIITLHTQEKHLEDVFHDLTTNDNQ